MGRPQKGMDRDEKEALAAYSPGCRNVGVIRKAEGVLRRIWPERAEQLRAKRGRPGDALVSAGIQSRFGMLTNPRMRDEQMGRPYTASEAVTKIVTETGRSRSDVNRLVRGQRAELERGERSLEAKRHAAVEAKRNATYEALRARYRELVRTGIKQWMIGNSAALEKELPLAHSTAVKMLTTESGLSSDEIERLIAADRATLSATLRKESRRRELDRHMSGLVF